MTGLLQPTLPPFLWSRHWGRAVTVPLFQFIPRCHEAAQQEEAWKARRQRFR